MKTILTCTAALLLLTAFQGLKSENPAGEWISLFDGKSLKDWKVNENPATFTVADGAIVAHGDRSHLFYDGPVMDHNFKNFEFKAKVMTTPGSNSGIYIHTAFLAEGFPPKGYEIQVNNSHTDWRRTGSVYGFQDIKVPPAKDDVWFTVTIIVNKNKIVVKINDQTVNDFTAGEGSKLSSGTFALQGHDPNSKVFYKDIMVKLLPD